MANLCCRPTRVSLLKRDAEAQLRPLEKRLEVGNGVEEEGGVVFGEVRVSAQVPVVELLRLLHPQEVEPKGISGSKPAHRLTPLSGARARQTRPLQSAVQIAEPVAGSHAPHAEGAHRRSMGGRQASPPEQSKSDWQGGTKLAHRPASGSPASLTPPSPRRAWQNLAEQSWAQTIPDGVQRHPVCRQLPSSGPRHSMFPVHSASVWQRTACC
jgi:hypothetical protein